jgi:hypothetical protein
MLRLVLYAGSLLLVSIGVFAQLTKLYSIDDSQTFDTVDFFIKATATNCLITKSVNHDNALTIYGNPDLDKIQPSFRSKQISNTIYAKLVLDEYSSSDFGDSFSFAVSSKSKNNDFWKINYKEDKIYRLDLNYGVGNADIDLSGVAVQKLKINSGSADIAVGYESTTENLVLMDTFYIKADFGSILTKHMEASRAKNVITKIGFGNVLLDFHDGLKEECSVNAHVGAGTLEVMLPESGVPVIIYVKDSPLCAVKIADGFEEVEDNVFVNPYYNSNASNLLKFNIDVALGMVQFKYH